MKYQLLACLLVAAPACVDVRPSSPPDTVSSLELTLFDPPPDQLGSPGHPVTAQQATFSVIAVNDQGVQVPGDVDVEVFISFGGVKTGAESACGGDTSGAVPLQIVHLTAGASPAVTVPLPSAFGATAIWLDDQVSHATGASPTIYFRNPFIDEVQKPIDPTATNATFCSPYNNRFMIVDQARPGGQLVVSSVFGSAFSVTDTGATAGFNNIYLYAFGKPPDYIQPGTIITSFSGNYSKFVGFTELNFPLFAAAQNPDGSYAAPIPTLVPAPIKLVLADLSNQAKLISASAGVVEYTGTICQPNPPNPGNDPNTQKIIDSWNKFDQFVLDNNGTCDSFTNFAVEIPTKVFGTFDPTTVAGQTLDVVGMLQNHSGQNPVTDANNNIVSCSPTVACPKPSDSCIMGDCYKGAYNFWTILPRAPDDIKSVTPVSM